MHHLTPQIKDGRLFQILESMSTMHLTNNCMHAPDTVALLNAGFAQNNLIQSRMSNFWDKDNIPR